MPKRRTRKGCPSRSARPSSRPSTRGRRSSSRAPGPLDEQGRRQAQRRARRSPRGCRRKLQETLSAGPRCCRHSGVRLADERFLTAEVSRTDPRLLRVLRVVADASRGGALRVLHARRTVRLDHATGLLPQTSRAGSGERQGPRIRDSGQHRTAASNRGPSGQSTSATTPSAGRCSSTPRAATCGGSSRHIAAPGRSREPGISRAAGAASSTIPTARPVSSTRPISSPVTPTGSPR